MYLSLSFCAYSYVSLFVFLCLFLCISLCLSLPVLMYLSLSFFAFSYVSLFVFLWLSLCIYLWLSLPVLMYSTSFCMSLSTFLYVSLLSFLPISMDVLPTLQSSRSFHRSKLTEGRALQGTRGLRKGSGTSNSALWMVVTWSQFSQTTLANVKNVFYGFNGKISPLSHIWRTSDRVSWTPLRSRPSCGWCLMHTHIRIWPRNRNHNRKYFTTLASDILRMSSSCASVKRVSGLSPSYQNLSHFRRFRNWIPVHAGYISSCISGLQYCTVLYRIYVHCTVYSTLCTLNQYFF